MQKHLRTLVAVGVLMLGAHAHCFAQSGDVDGGPVPEISPSMVGSGLVLLSGAIFLIRGNRKR